MNPGLARLRPYPFERLRALLAGVVPPADLAPVNLSIGEPRHATPPFIEAALAQGARQLSTYPATRGNDSLREALARWLERRFELPALDPGSEVLPVTGSREALFSLAQTLLAPGAGHLVLMPNPGYQIYEGAALLAGAEPRPVALRESLGWRMDWDSVTPAEWARVKLVYTCSPGNPTGQVMDLEDWRALFALSDRHGFVIASDECYSEIYPDEAHPPLGGLAAAQQLGRAGYPRLITLGSLSKRSNVPGLRSGYVAGDAHLVAQFLAYRTYHGSAMGPAVQAASEAAWADEGHVRENRRLYAEKFALAQPALAGELPAALPDASFYLWARTPGDDAQYVRELYARANVLLLPGSFLAREFAGENPGAGRVRIALVPALTQVALAIERIRTHGPAIRAALAPS